MAALDDVTSMRGILALFEGVATGAADGYSRIAGRPAATLLHLGPGLGNGLANLHNARRAHSPIVNIVGDHAISHRPYDAQLQSDIATVARNVSSFVRTTESTPELGRDAVDTLVAAYGPPGSVATLILPADVSWSDGGAVAPVVDGVGTRASDRRTTGPGRARDGGRRPPIRRTLGTVHRWPGLLGAPPRRRRRPRRRHRCRTAVRDISGPARPRRGTATGGAARLSGRVRLDAPRWHPTPGTARRQLASVVLRLPGKAQRPGP